MSLLEVNDTTMVRVQCPACQRWMQMPQIATPMRSEELRDYQDAEARGLRTLQLSRFCLFCGQDAGFTFAVPRPGRIRSRDFLSEQLQFLRSPRLPEVDPADVALALAERYARAGNPEETFRQVDAWLAALKQPGLHERCRAAALRAFSLRDSRGHVDERRQVAEELEDRLAEMGDDESQVHMRQDLQRSLTWLRRSLANAEAGGTGV